MRTGPSIPWLTALTLAALLGHAPPARAFHTVFDFAVDRFEADGNRFGHLVENFDGPALTNFTHVLGTAELSDGHLHLKSPGTHNTGLLAGSLLDMSDVYSTASVQDFGGSFTMTAYWEPTPLAYGNYIHMTLFMFGLFSPLTGPIDAFSLSLSNFTPEGQPTVYSAVRTYLRSPQGLDGSWDTFETEFFSIAPEDITGQIAFRLSFDAGTRSAQASISVDGGATFQAPFTPHGIFAGTQYGMTIIGADPLAASDEPPPFATTTTTSSSSTSTTTTLPPVPCTSGAFLSGQLTVLPARGFTGSTRAILRGRIDATRMVAKDYDPARDGLRLVMHDAVVPDGVAFDHEIPSAAVAGCGPRDGWHRVGRAHVYRNRSGGLPPACGPAQGLRSVRIGDPRAKDGTMAVTIRANGLFAVRDRPGKNVISTTVYFGTGTEGPACAVVSWQCTGEHTLRCDPE